MQFFINGLEVTVTPIEKKNHMTHHVGVRQEGFSMGFFIPSILPEQMEHLITAELSQRLTQLAERVNRHLYHAMAEKEYSIPEGAAEDDGEDEDEDEDGDIATGVRRRRWTKEENRLLLEAYFSNTSYEEIAQRHQRTSAAVRIRISKLLRGGK